VFWQVFIAVLAALIVYKCFARAINAYLEKRQLRMVVGVYEKHVLSKGDILTGYEITDYETGDIILWDDNRNCEWRFSRYDGPESPRTWRITNGDVSSFLRTATNLKLRRDEPEEDHGQFIIASQGTPNPRWLQRKDKS
jgi:hypothetical protein